MKSLKLWPLLLAALCVACVPAYTSNRNFTPPMGVTGVYLGVFYSGTDLDAQVMLELSRSLSDVGLKVTNIKYPDPKGASIKLEGDLVPALSSEPRPSKFARAEIRVIEFRSGKTLAQYHFEAKTPLEMRSPSGLARDVADLMSKDFKQLP